MEEKKKIVFALRFAIIIFALAGLAFVGYVEPFGILKIYASAPWLEIVFYWVCSLPCFFVLVLAWKITSSFKQGKFFETGSARDISISGWILGVDGLLFIIGNILVYFLKPNGQEFFYLFLGVTAVCLGIFFIVLADYMKKAIALKQDNEAIV